MRRRLLVLLASVLALAGACVAWAYFSASVATGSSGRAQAATVNQGSTPTATVSSTTGREVDLSWGATTLANGSAVAGYVVTRYPQGGGAGTINPFSTCAGSVTGTSCAETDVPPGSWQYTVTPVIGTNWRGAEGALSGVVTVGTESLSLAGSPFAAAAFTGLPAIAHATGSIGGFAGNEDVAYNLDSNSPLSGTALTGSPTKVSQSGNASITDLQIPETAGDGAHTVWALGDALFLPSVASSGIVVDTVAPSVTATLTPSPNGAGWNNTSPVQVTLAETDPAPSAGSGPIKYTTDGSDPTTSGTAQTYSAPFTVSGQGMTTIKFYGNDAVGNASGVATQLVKIDTAAPTNAFSLTSQSGGSLLSGSTIYYQGANAGSFKLSDSVGDSGSGPASTGYAALTGSTSGWSFTSSSATSGPPYVSNAFSWGGGTSSNPSETATGFDAAGNSTAATISFVNDSTPPTGGALTVNGETGASTPASGWNTSGSFSITSLTDYTETQSSSQSGLSSSTLTLQSASLTSSNGTSTGTCGIFGSATAISSRSLPIGQTGLTTGCYRYTLTGTDNVGNAASVSAIVMVDTSGPSTPAAATLTPVTGTSYQSVSGSTIWFNPAHAGSFTADSSVSDNDSGISKVTFPSLASLGVSGGGAVTTPNSGTTFRTTYSLPGGGSGSVAPAAQTITATNNAGTSAGNTSAFSVGEDGTAPTGGALSVNSTSAAAPGTYSTTSSTAFSITRTNYTDAGSGIASSTLTIQSFTLSGGACGSAAGAYSSPTTISGTTNPTITAGYCYLYKLTGTDNVANSASISTTIEVSSSPNIVVQPGIGLAGGTVTVSWSGVTSAWGASEPSTTDWISIFSSPPPTPSSSNYDTTNWIYDSSCTKTAGSSAKASGSCSYTLPSTPGTYVFALLANNVYTPYVFSAPFTVQAAPTVTGASPTAGSTNGGTSVTITGTSFTSATEVDFGGTPAPSFVVNSATSITATTPAHSAGLVNVAVTTPVGTGTGTNAFTYDGTPTVTAVSPSTGSTSGGISVTLTGTGFLTATAVSFGGTAGTINTITSDTSMTVTSPAGSAGAVDVTVTGSTGTSAVNAPADQFTYVPPPTVTGVSPAGGPIAGGTTVTVTGTNLTGATAVDFGATAVTSGITVNGGGTSLTVASPAHAAGSVDVTVITPGGTSATNSNDEFTFDGTPTVSSISPSSGTTAGGTSVTITGTGFLTTVATTGVKFGAANASSFTVNSDTQITATAPAGSGTVDITVTNTAGTSAKSSADIYSYTPLTAPTVTSISPSTGPAAGGTVVTITGTNFTAASSVAFGANAGTSVTVNSSTSITATSPAGTGTVDVTVTNSAGTSATNANDKFTYTSLTISGVYFTNIVLSGGSSNCASQTVSANITCTANPLGGTGTFTANVEMVNSSGSPVTNTSGSAVTVSCSETTVSSPGGTVTPSSSTIANGSVTTASTFQLKGNGGGWKGTMTCSVVVGGNTYSISVTGN